jgi:uncharacterized protein (TIGR03437 family)
LVYNGAPFGPFDEPVLFANPTFFRLQPGISTQAAAINQDGTINGPGNPASAGSVVSLYGTGFGQTNPSCITGALNAPMPVNLALGVSVGLNAGSPGPQVQYAGGAPGLLCGAVQVNIMVPSQTPAGPFEVTPWAELTNGNSLSGVGSGIWSTILVK